MTPASQQVRGTQDRRRAFARAAGNLFFGIAIGLVAYTNLTDLVTRDQQAALASEFARPSVAETMTVEGAPVMDFADWESTDLESWRMLDEGKAFGRLVAPKMGLDAVVVKGTSRSDLQKGPGWITWTDVPGPTGNCGISGHRTTFGAPFRHIDALKKGDTIEFYSPYRRYTYRVSRVFAVRPDQVEVVASTEKPTLTLTACHPPYSARQRIIVQSDLVEVVRLEP